MPQKVLDIPFEGDAVKGFPHLERKVEKHGLMCSVLPPGPLEVNIDTTQVTIDINLNPVNHITSFNGGPFVESHIPADSVAILPPGANWKLKSDNHLPGFVMTVDEDMFREAVGEDVFTIMRDGGLADYRPEGTTAQLGRAGIRMLTMEYLTSEVTDTLALEHLGRTVMERIGEAVGNPRTSEEFPTHHLSRNRFDLVTSYIEDNLESSILVSDLAELAGLSTSHFSKAFRETAFMPPARFIVGRRVERAKLMLCDTEESLSSIAFTCGFSGQSHMTRLFKMHVGTTPGRYRQELCG